MVYICDGLVTYGGRMWEGKAGYRCRRPASRLFRLEDSFWRVCDQCYTRLMGGDSSVQLPDTAAKCGHERVGER